MAGLLGIELGKTLTIPAGGSEEIRVGTGLILINIEGVSQFIACCSSYWLSSIISNLGSSYISVEHATRGQYLIITNLTDSDKEIVYEIYNL